MHTLPLVSVIVPVMNGEKTIQKLIEALLSQDYPKSHTEIIIVDNGSQDHTISIIKKYPVILAFENKLASSYAARNKGISLATGGIIAFTDADCIPEPNWITEGVQAITDENADMAGGRISFIFSARKSDVEYFDSIRFMDNERYIKNRLGAATANLFVRANVFNQVGLFKEFQSGGDIQWTSQALKEGFSLIYAPKAIVMHPTRNICELFEKSRRIGIGILNISRKRESHFKILYIMIRQLIPIPSIKILKLIIASKRQHHNIIKHLFTAWGFFYLLQINQLAGMLSSIFQVRKK